LGPAALDAVARLDNRIVNHEADGGNQKEKAGHQKRNVEKSHLSRRPRASAQD
jgi:hypothetical protein